jgi:FkbM family methyltransferase
VQTVLTQLSRLSPEPFDCIVHVGAGADADSADYSALNPKHIVLIEADPEAYAALAERFAGAPNVTVVNALVAPQSGETAFHRFSLRSFNAPLGLGHLREIYPRIELLEELRIDGQALDQVLAEHAELLGTRNVLILDIPGQEAAVLRELPLEFLERFCSMVLLASAESWQEGSEPLEATLATLKERNFQLAREASDDPAWPAIVVRRDEAKAKLQAELDRSARLFVAKATQIHQQTEQIIALTTERDTLATRVSSLESEHADLATRHSSLATALEELRGQHSSLSTLHSSLVAERDDLVTRHTSLATEREALQSQHTSLIAERDGLIAERDSLLQERDEIRSERNTLAQERDRLIAERDALSQERDALTRECSQLVAERDDLATGHTSLVTALEDLQGQHTSLVTESEALRSDLSAKTTLLDVLSKGRIAQDEQMEKYLKEKQTLILERDALASRVSDLTSQVEKLEAHAKLIDEEFGKAEGQIELIKDIFLREAIR